MWEALVGRGLLGNGTATFREWLVLLHYNLLPFHSLTSSVLLRAQGPTTPMDGTISSAPGHVGQLGPWEAAWETERWEEGEVRVFLSCPPCSGIMFVAGSRSFCAQ